MHLVLFHNVHFHRLKVPSPTWSVSLAMSTPFFETAFNKSGVKCSLRWERLRNLSFGIDCLVPLSIFHIFLELYGAAVPVRFFPQYFQKSRLRKTLMTLTPDSIISHYFSAKGRDQKTSFVAYPAPPPAEDASTKALPRAFFV